MHPRKTIKTADGTVLEVKEGELLDDGGKAITGARKKTNNNSRVFVYRGGFLPSLVFAVLGIPLVIFAGFWILVVALLGFLAFMVFGRTFFKVFRIMGGRR